MKAKTVLLIFFLLLGCEGIKPVSNEVEKPASLVFIGESRIYSDGITIAIDDKDIFSAEVCADLDERAGGRVYEVTPGKHLISVKHGESVIFKKQVTIKDHDLNKVVLP